MDVGKELHNDEKELISRFKNGNESAFNLLVIKYQKKLYSLIYKFVLDQDETNDLLQEVFIKVYNSIGSFREVSGFYTWLYRITINMTLNNIKKNKSVKFTSLEEVNVAGTDETKILDNLNNNSKIQFLKYAVSQLPQHQKIIFCLRHYEGLSYQEIAEITGESVGGLKANYFHAFAKISEIMKDKFWDNE